MARERITYLDVALAAEKITGTQQAPTVDRVRQTLGGRGSNSTIAPLLKRWKEEHQGLTATANLGLPPELIKSVQMIHEQLQANAEIRVTALQEKHTQLVQDLTEQLDEFQQQQTGLLERLETQGKALGAAQAEIEHTKSRLQQQEVWNAEAKAANAGLQQRNTDLVNANAQLGALLEQNRVGLEHFQEVTGQQRAEERRMAEQREARLKKEVEAAIALAKLHASSQATLTAENQHLKSALQESKKLLEETHQQLGALSRERDQAGFELREVMHQHKALTKQHDIVNGALSEALRTQAVAEGEKRLMAERLQQLEDKHGNVVNNLQIALQEKAGLEGQLRQLSGDHFPRQTTPSYSPPGGDK